MPEPQRSREDTLNILSRRSLAVFLFALSISASPILSQAPRMDVVPARPSPGALVRLSLKLPVTADSVIWIRGSMAGEPLHFIEAGDHTWRALGAVPVDGSDRVSARVIVERASGALDTVRRTVTIPALEEVSVTKSPQLAVSSRFTRPLDAATRARIARENALARAVGSRAHDSPPRWTGPFVQPRTSRVTSRFGTGRAFNGAVTSRHLGVDFAGAVGAPIKAANRGVVALVDTFFLAGRVIYIDHGAGVVTGYFHLSEPLVSVGDTVTRGQTIGRVGSTGRTTGPHLHWTARYGTRTVDPFDLVELETGWYGLKDREPSESTRASPPGSK